MFQVAIFSVCWYFKLIDGFCLASFQQSEISLVDIEASWIPINVLGKKRPYISKIGNIWLHSIQASLINYPQTQYLEMSSIIKKWPMSDSQIIQHFLTFWMNCCLLLFKDKLKCTRGNTGKWNVMVIDAKNVLTLSTIKNFEIGKKHPHFKMNLKKYITGICAIEL